MMDCADRLDPATARKQASQIQIENWSDAFQHSILMGAAEPTIAERRKMVDSMNTFSLNFPRQFARYYNFGVNNRYKQLILLKPILVLSGYSKIQTINLTV